MSRHDDENDDLNDCFTTVRIMKVCNNPSFCYYYYYYCCNYYHSHDADDDNSDNYGDGDYDNNDDDDDDHYDDEDDDLNFPSTYLHLFMAAWTFICYSD